MTDKIKEKDLCDPNDILPFIIANQSRPHRKKSEVETQIKDKKNNLAISKLICQMSKRKVISDMDFLIKEINVRMITNYVSSLLI